MKGFILFISLGFLIGLVSFNETELDSKNTTQNFKSKGYTEEEIDYFKEITLKNELNYKIRQSPAKFNRDVKIFIHGQYEPYMLDEVKRVVSDLNDIIDSIDLSIVNNRSEANVIMYFGDYQTFISDNPDLKRIDKIKNSEGFFTTKSGGPTEIESSRIFINLPKQDGVLDLKDCIREEITQSLGLFNDTYTYPESTFYGGQNSVLEYPKIDIKIIKMLYNE
jgi:hypothetical protein